MKTKKIKERSVVAELRTIREKVSQEIKDLSPKELKEFFRSKKETRNIRKRKVVKV